MLRNSFARGPEGWCSYDYHASIVTGRNVFILATWEKEGGVANSGYVWVDHTRWSADTPEKPLSILPLLLYRSWVNADAIDLRDAEVSVYLRGDNLRLDGAQCFFWIHGVGGRWHYTSHPLSISDAGWSSAPLRFSLQNDEQLWHHSWPRDPNTSRSLESILGQVLSYGFSFVGFSSEVSGRLCMGEFEIKLPEG
ncbi:MAG: hypothetical protein KAT86_04830 [Candidatus Latescibacteria bacterium]|nr:hypothetical protein [Candidatus Latescibacterota bacterium]